MVRCLHASVFQTQVRKMQLQRENLLLTPAPVSSAAQVLTLLTELQRPSMGSIKIMASCCFIILRLPPQAVCSKPRTARRV
jgi:hypothetical protein